MSWFLLRSRRLADQESRSGGIAGQIEAQQARIGEIGVQLARIDEKLRAALEADGAWNYASAGV